MSSIIRKKLFSQNAGTGGGSSTPTTQIIRYNVLNYSALATLTPNTGEFAYVQNEQGTKWLPGTIGGTYYASGLYYYTGTTWINDLTSIAAQLALNDTAILALQTGKVPYTGATTDVNLGVYDITADHLIKNGGVNSQFLKADGSVDNNVYLTSADLPSTLELFTTTTPDPLISGYSVLVRNIGDVRFNTVPVDVSTGTITTTNQLVGSLITDANIISGDPGIFDFKTIGNISRTVGTGQAEFFFRIYKRTALGVETLIAQSSNTLPVINSGYVEFSATALWNDGIFLDTDRVVIKYYANRLTSPVGSDPTYNFQFGGLSPVRSFGAIPVAVIPNIYLRDLSDVENVDALPNEVLYWNDTASLWEHSLVIDLLSAANATTNGYLSSTDWSKFNSKVGGSGTANYISKFTATGTVGNSLIQEGTLGNISVNTTPDSGVQFLVNSTTSPDAGRFVNSNIDTQTTAIRATSNGVNTFNNVGGVFSAVNGANNYAIQLFDGTQAIGKYLKCVGANGEANWDYYSPFIAELKPQEVYRGITINNNSTTIIADGGITTSTTGSTLAQSVASTNLSTKQIRLRYYNTTVSAGKYTGIRGSALLWYIHGGFRYVCDFNISDTSYSAGCQQFYGLGGQTGDLGYGGVAGTLVSTLTNIIGVGSETGDTNLQVFHNGAAGTATKVNLGINFPANRTVGAISTTVYSITLYNAPMSTSVLYRVVNNETGAIAEGTISTNLPLTSQGLNFFASRCMSTASITSTGQFDLSKLGTYSLL